MLILAFESSARPASVALLRDGQLLSQYSQCSQLTHSRTLLPMAETMAHTPAATAMTPTTIPSAISTFLPFFFLTFTSVVWVTVSAIWIYLLDRNRSAPVCSLMSARAFSSSPKPVTSAAAVRARPVA